MQGLAKVFKVTELFTFCHSTTTNSLYLIGIDQHKVMHNCKVDRIECIITKMFFKKKEKKVSHEFAPLSQPPFSVTTAGIILAYVSASFADVQADISLFLFEKYI